VFEPVGAASIRYFLDALFRAYEDAFFQARSGLFDETLWQACPRSLPDFLAAPGITTWWDIRKGWYSQEFQVYVDQVKGSGHWPAYNR